MKKFFSILVVSLLLGLPMKAQWTQSYLWPSQQIRNLSVLNDNIIWTKDFNDTKISYTIDGGLNWTTKILPVTWNFQEGGICAVNATTAYNIVCQGTEIGIYKTSDAGSTWNKQTSGFNSTSSFADFIYFWNVNEGVAVGDGNTTKKFEIYTTSNGGSTWDSIPNASLPTGPIDYTYNLNNVFRVHGNTIYFLTNFGKIMKSTNKGISWTEINTPLTTITGGSFDFKDNLNGILSNSTTGQVYSSSDGGTTWMPVSTSPFIGDLRYSSANNAYLSANYSTGYSYSTDNGLSWIQNQSFNKMGIGMIDVTSTGKVFIGGSGSVFYTNNYQTEYIAVKNVALTGTNTIDVSYTKVPYLQNSTDSTNYQLSAIRLGKVSKVLIKSISQDASDKSLMHLVMDTNLPSDTIRLIIKNIYELNGTAKGNPMLYNEPGITTTFKNYSTSKTVNITTPGTLNTFVSTIERLRVIQLTVTGTIDARDFRIIRDSLTAVSVLDIGATTVAAYIGTEGTYTTASTAYIANEIPRTGLYNKKGAGLTSIILPATITSIARSAFNTNSYIKSIVIPSGVTSIGQLSFASCTNLRSVSIPGTVTSLGLGAFYNCIGLSSIHDYSTAALALPVLSNSTNDVFYGDPTSTCTLYVPLGSSSLYKAGNQWSSFSNVVEFDASIYHASLPDYSTVKYGLIGSCYFLNNVSGGTKAAWNTIWKDVANNVQASLPAISGNGKIFSWNFPGVYMVGGASFDGMFKFCIPNTDNTTPNWSIEPIGFKATNTYTGSSAANVDRAFDVGGAFSIITAGLIKKYDLKLIIDQTTGIDQITLDINGLNTAVSSVNLASSEIVSYRIYNVAGTLLSTNELTSELNLQYIKQTLKKGVYLINAKLNTGESQNFKFIVQ